MCKHYVLYSINNVPNIIKFRSVVLPHYALYNIDVHRDFPYTSVLYKACCGRTTDWNFVILVHSLYYIGCNQCTKYHKIPICSSSTVCIVDVHRDFPYTSVLYTACCGRTTDWNFMIFGTLFIPYGT